MMFAVGMIVTCHDKIRDRLLSGVIIGWDEEFNSCVEIEWKQCRPLYNRPVLDSNTLSQPFYKVLCGNNKAYYVVEGISKLLEASYIYFIDIVVYYMFVYFIFMYDLIYIMHKRIYSFDYRCYKEDIYTKLD